MLHRLAGLALAVLALLVSASVAAAAPVTVNLRVEGPSSTVFEGPVTTDVRAFQFTAGGDTGPHECDATAVNTGTSPTPVPTRGAAIAAASLGAPFSASGTFSAQFGSPSFDQVGGQSTAFDPATNSFLAEYKNGVAASVGACADPIANGDDVLFAYGTGADPLLRLTGPSSATTGAAVAVHVIDQTNGAPVAGASVAGATTDAAGNAVVRFAQAGVQRLKATKAGAIRSNALVVAVGAVAGQTAAQAVAGATVDRTAPRARLLSPRNGHTYRRATFSPRLIHVAVAESGSGVRTVKIRLTRRLGNRCFSFSGKRERFIGTKCGDGGGFFFTVSDRADFTYLLPERLSRGHYVLDVEAIDNSFNRDTVGDRGRNRSVFDVR
ncbi:MAG: hypothetical protein QOH72_3966 [Solirubrobacteraceae bacterium]|nr:hypothetical protein [Solirubrobacteraceae bacterium]